MKRKIFTILVLLEFCLTINFSAQEFDWNEPLELDTSVVRGELENGIKYYIKKNSKPENRAELRLAINAGSILEDDNQRGLAHFVEHMAFNGTKNFPEHELIDYLETIGTRFGPDLNASTGFDQTIYMLEVRTDSIDQFEKGFFVLSEWAQNISFDSTEIEKERGVVVEEWRLGRGAWARIRDKQFPVLFKDSRYAERLPIGKKEIIETAPQKVITSYYKDWYRPDLMAVVAVGDFDVERVCELINENFSSIKHAADAKERKTYPVPDHEETLVAIAADKEATYSAVSVYYKKHPHQLKTLEDYRENVKLSLYNAMFNDRLYELSQQAEPPFLNAFSNQRGLVHTKEAYTLTAIVEDNGIETGLRSLLKEAERIRQFGFTESELKRAKKEGLRRMERYYDERDKIESSNWVWNYIEHYMTGDAFLSPEQQLKLFKEILPGIEMEEVNRLSEKLITDDNRVVLVSLPEKEGVAIPTEDEIYQIIESSDKIEVEPYVDRVSDEELISMLPNPGTIADSKYYDELDVTELDLSNGVKVVLKPTDFQNDEILFTAFSPGGNTLVDDENYISSLTAASLVNLGGLGKFDNIELNKKLSDKIVRVSPYISPVQEGLNGNASPKDIETMFQMIYLYFTEPRVDSNAYFAYRKQVENFLKNKNASPYSAFNDTLTVTLAQYHPRSIPFTEKVLEEMNLDSAFAIYIRRFADASDFTFVFVGNFTLEEIEPYIKTYLATLPSIDRTESWKDLGIDYPAGIIKKNVYKGIEPKSTVSINFLGDFNWNRQSIYNLRATAQYLDIRLREVLREDRGGTYNVSINAYPSKIPDEDYRITVMFGCDPGKVDTLIGDIFTQIDSLKQNGPKEGYVERVREMQLRKRETDLKENSTWLNTLKGSYWYGSDPREIIWYEDLIKGLTAEAIQSTAKEYFNENNYVEVVLYPKEKSSGTN